MSGPVVTLPMVSSGQGLGLGRLDTNVLEKVLHFLRPGMGFDQALQDAVEAGAVRRGDLTDRALSEGFQLLSPGSQRQLSEQSATLPPVLREALHQLGLSSPPPAHGERASTMADATRARGDIAATTTRPEAMTNGFQTRATSAPVTPAAGTNGPVPGERLLNASPMPPTARMDEATAFQRGEIARMGGQAADRALAAMTPAMAQQAAAVAPHVRGDALYMQALTQVAGVSVIAQPQGAVMASPSGTPARAALDAPAPVAPQLAPGGHTMAGGTRRDVRTRIRTSAERTPSWLGLMRRRGRGEDPRVGEDAPVRAFHWLFWLLTAVAYGALAVALVTMVPGGAGLIDSFGEPTRGAYALAVGAVAALASWWLGRRLSRN